MDFFSKYESTNTIGVERSSTTNCRASNLHGNLYVYSGKLDFKLYTPEWNITTDLASTVTKDAYLAETASTYYYLYLKDTGDRVMSDIGPIKRDDLLGEYHPHNPWRCVGLVFNNSSSDLEGNVTDGDNKVSNSSVCVISQAQNPPGSAGGGTVSAGTSWTVLKLNVVIGETWFVTGGFDGSGGTNTNFTLAGGTYECNMVLPMYSAGANAFGSMALYNVTDTTYIKHSIGGNYYHDGAGNGGDTFSSHFVFSISSSKTFQMVAGSYNTAYIVVYASSGVPTGPSEFIFNRIKVRKIK
jgi:hypothetical protein